MRALVAWALSCALALVAVPRPAAAPAPARAMSMAAFLEGRWPSRPSWSPDGQYVSFLSTDWVTQDLYYVPAEGGDPIALTHASGFVGGPRWDGAEPFGSWAPGARALVYAHEGDLYRVEVPGGATTRLTTTGGIQAAQFAPRDDRLAWIRNGDLHVLGPGDAQPRQVTRAGGLEGSATWSPDGRFVAATAADRGERFTGGPAFLGPPLSIAWSRPPRRAVALVEVATGAVTRLGSPEGSEAPLAWAPDGTRLVTEARTGDFTRRTLWLRHPADPSRDRPLYRQQDPLHLATNNQVAAFSPDGRFLLFTSDEDGWNHLYLVAAAGGAPQQLTKGAYEVSRPSWSRDGRSICFASSETGSDQRQVYRLDVATGRAERLTASAGVNADPLPAPASDRVLFAHADPTSVPDLWVLDPAHPGSPRRLTDSKPPRVDTSSWQAPRIVTIRARDGLSIRAQLFTPVPFDPAARYPAVVRVHEATENNQEVFLGPGLQKNSLGWYGWHQRLARRGYVVLNVDYRGSFGYGRDFRTADHLVMGVAPLEDVVDAVEYLRALGFVDPDRLAVVGLSAGGRMVLSLVGKYPRLFKAGIDLAGIHDYLLPGGPWDARNPWVLARLGTPDRNPVAYREASPKTYVESIAAPLLVLHGTKDTNVTVTQSLALADDLLRLGKRFDLQIYPGEVHYFARRTTWLDAFERMEAFLDRHVGSATTP